MCSYAVAILFKRKQVRQLMQQRNQKRKLVKVSVYRKTVRLMRRAVAVIAQNTFALARNG